MSTSVPIGSSMTGEEYVTVTDPDGFSVNMAQYGGVYFPGFPGIKQRLDALKTFKGRDDDVLILAYPKCGTHWTWEIARMLSQNTTKNVKGEKLEDFLELVDQEKLNAVSSPRLLNSHIRPNLLPPDLVQRKCKIIYVQRNPKDVCVSLFNHVRNINGLYKYDGIFAGFFEMMMSGKVESGSWFDYSRKFEKFFAIHPDVPVLRLHYEDMKKDLLSNVHKISEFCGYAASVETMEGITEACTFSSMKQFKVEIVDERFKHLWRGGQYNLYRKGVAGDWKNYFTVAQNERFDAESKRQLKGSGVEVRWVN